MALTVQQLRKMAPHLSAEHATAYLAPLNFALHEYEIGQTNERVAAFMAQILHETGELHLWHELWGPTLAQRRYEGRVDLGNTQPGDGFRFRGRGLFQLTGRANYRLIGQKLGVNLEADPELAAHPEYGFRIAGLYWQNHSLNHLADQGRFEEITRRINGGLNGLTAREAYWQRALKVLRGEVGG